MTVRSFNGSSDDIVCSIGGMDGATFGTAVFLVKRGGTGSWNTLTTFNGTGIQFAFHPNSQIVLFTGNTYFGPSWMSTEDWVLIVYRIAEANAAVEFSVFDFDTETWSHASSSGTLSTWGALDTDMSLSWGGSGDWWHGLIAARAFWADSVPWATTGAVEAAGLETGAAAWMDADPDTMHLFDQASTSDPVEDVTGGGADQTSISGTTVVVDDDPPGWDFSLDDDPEPAEGTAVAGLGLALSASGARGSSGPAAPAGLGLGLSAAGGRDSAGSAGAGLVLQLSATGARPSAGTAVASLGLGLVAAGPAGQVEPAPPEVTWRVPAEPTHWRVPAESIHWRVVPA